MALRVHFVFTQRYTAATPINHLAADWTDREQKGLDALNKLSLQYTALPTVTTATSTANCVTADAISGAADAISGSNSAICGSVFSIIF
ncbi:hypothetical protein [Pseudomonas sihuiensis]|uniref:hypothetical protein n=1 Tax=Pseudomonas sihuiensis TaxID=1274359 RepID=UPI0012FE11C6|nr:hypothetical protein [Pseudomonas sihuiensis]